jgi:alkanesulfonate monooxygenase SsuD/methylene tetrahydromethanopterin reductase-like flavin-dependent oxidoreductase (luciferase family)
VLLAALTPAGLRRIGRRLDGRLPVAMPVRRLMGTWRVIQKGAEEAGRAPSTPRMALRVNPRLSDTRTDPGGQMPAAGTLAQYVDYARSAADASVHELFVDFGQTVASLAERVDLVGRFIEGVRRG